MTRRIVSSRSQFGKFAKFAGLQLLVAGSTLSASALAADAAGTPTTDTKPLLGMQTDSTAPGAAPAAPPSGANTVGGSGGATLTLGGDGATAGGSATPATGASPDQPKESPKEEKKHWLDKFAGSSLYNQTSANLNTFFPSLQADRNATVDTYALFGPRYALSKSFQLRGRIGIAYEFTNGDTTYRNEPMLTDTTLSLFYRGIPSFAHIQIAPSISVGLPTSKASLARGMYFNPGLGLQAAYGNDHILGGELGLIFIASYNHPVYNSKAATRDPAPYGVSTSGPPSGVGGEQQISPGPMNASDGLSFNGLVTQQWGDFEPGLWMSVRSEFVYTPKEVPGVRSVNDPNTVRNSTYFSFWLDYHLNDWLTPELGYYMSRRVLADDGKIGNPFFSEYQDMRVYLGANIQLDSLFKSVLGVKAESGIVRAQNKKTPMMAF